MELKRGMHVYPEFPTHIKIELVGGCNRRCSFCGIMYKNVNVMSEDLFGKILGEITEREKEQPCSVKTIDFCMHGESTLDPDICVRIARLRRVLPFAKFILATNGDRALQENGRLLFSMFSSGLDYVLLDAYDSATYAKVTELTPLFEKEFNVRSVYADGVNVYGGTKPKRKTLVVAHEEQGINSGKNIVRSFNTQGGSVPIGVWKDYDVDTSLFPILKTCAEFKKIFPITWEGKIKICCSDGSGFFFAELGTQSIKEIWKSELANEIRYVLSIGRRDVLPSCYACNRISFRDGLWPNHTEKTYVLRNIADRSVRLLFAQGVSEKFVANMKELSRRHGLANIFLSRAVDKEKQ